MEFIVELIAIGKGNNLLGREFGFLVSVDGRELDESGGGVREWFSDGKI